MKKRLVAVFLSMAMVVSILGGCQKKDAADGGDVKIYYAAIESGDYYEGWASQLQEQAKKQGAGFDVGYAEKSVETQDAQVKSAVSDGCNVFLCGLVSADIATEIKAAAEDVPIVFINQAPADEQLEKDRYIYVASDEYMAGQYQAEDNADWSEETAKEMMGMFLKTGRTVDCVVANNDDMAGGAVTAFEEAGADLDSVLFLGVDASANGCQAIADGRMDFTVYQPMSDQISAAVLAAQRLAEGKPIGDIEGASKDGKYILVPFEKVDASNVKQYM